MLHTCLARYIQGQSCAGSHWLGFQLAQDPTSILNDQEECRLYIINLSGSIDIHWETVRFWCKACHDNLHWPVSLAKPLLKLGSGIGSAMDDTCFCMMEFSWPLQGANAAGLPRSSSAFQLWVSPCLW